MRLCGLLWDAFILFSSFFLFFVFCFVSSKTYGLWETASCMISFICIINGKVYRYVVYQSGLILINLFH